MASFTHRLGRHHAHLRLRRLKPWNDSSRVAGMAHAALFAFLAACLGAVAIWAGAAGSWIIAVAAGVIAVWLASFAWSTVRRTRS